MADCDDDCTVIRHKSGQCDAVAGKIDECFRGLHSETITRQSAAAVPRWFIGKESVVRHSACPPPRRRDILLQSLLVTGLRPSDAQQITSVELINGIDY